MNPKPPSVRDDIDHRPRPYRHGLAMALRPIWPAAHATPAAPNQKANAMPASPRLPRMLSKQQAADLLSLSLKTITRKIQTGQLRSHRFGRSVRISEEDLAAFTAAGRR